jgi:EmrB/QacA subfamily drug resistance transporter
MEATLSLRRRKAPARGETAPKDPSLRQGWLLVVCCVAQFMVILDVSIVNVALPHIQLGLGFSSAQLPWVVDAYAITFAGFLMLGGRVADHFGQRRTFVAGLAGFALASLAGGLASSSTMLVAARAAQGLAGAFMAACSLAIITASFEPGAKLNRAIGIWAATNGVAGAAGVLLGGVITEFLSWRWVLLINPPIGLAAALAAWLVVSERRRSGAHSFDLAGAVTLTVGQMVLVYGIVEGDIAGWGSLAALGPIVAGIALLALFSVIEERFASLPLIPFKELTRGLRVANTIVLLFSAALFPMWFVSSLYLQQVLGLSPLNTGLIFLPMSLMVAVGASRAGALVGRFGVRSVLGGGLVMLAVGMALLARIGPGGSAIVYVMIPGLITAAGIGMSIVPSTIAATQGAGEGQAGLASGLVNTSRQVGAGLGLAILVTLATQHSTDLIGSGTAVPQALTDGFRLAFQIGAGLAGAAALLTFLALPRPAHVQARAARRLSVAFGVVVAAFVAANLGVHTHGAPIGAYTKSGAYSYVSAPSLHPPVIRADAPIVKSRLAPGYILLGSFYELSSPPMVGQSGPLMLDNNLQPVWFEPVPEREVAANLNLQTFDGRPALAWWQGAITKNGDTLSGEDVLVDRHYKTLARLKGSNGWIITLHELYVQGDHAWVTANRNVPRNLSAYGGAYNGVLIDSAVQEYDLKTGRLLYTWDALDHIPLGDSRATLPSNGYPWDAYHVNSVDLLGDGTFVVSMRNTWAAYDVVAATGRIAWTLGGRHSSFKFGQGASFQWQHDVRLYPGSSLITLFDDHCCQLTGGGTRVPASGPSRGLLLRLDRGARTATLAGQFTRGSGFDTDYMGSVEPLSGGNELVGWGSEPYFSEYDSSGKLLLDAVLPGSDLSYRARLEPWVGEPLYPPSGAARARGGASTVYASWNGATEVVSWRVLAGASAGALKPVAHAQRAGFQTAIPLPSAYAVYRVQALNAQGRAIGTSAPFGAR